MAIWSTPYPSVLLERGGCLSQGGGTVGRLGKVRIWHRSTVPGYIHNLNLMMQCLYYFGVPRYAFSTENIICIGYTHNKWQKQDSINLSPPQSNSNNNQRTNSLIGIQKTLMAYIFLFESKKKKFSQRWSYQRCSHEFFRLFAQLDAFSLRPPDPALLGTRGGNLRAAVPRHRRAAILHLEDGNGIIESPWRRNTSKGEGRTT